MPYTELIAIAALIVAIWQLYLQRLEIKRSTNIQCLQNIAMILKTEIDVIEAMITDRKQKDKSFVNLAARVNNELRPQYLAIMQSLAENSSDQALAKETLIMLSAKKNQTTE